MKNRLGIVICGASGRMGREILNLSLDDPKIQLIAACTRAASPNIGKDVAELLGRHLTGVHITNTFEGSITPKNGAKNVIIDFSAVDAILEHANLAARLGIPYMVGVTGLSDVHFKQLGAVARKIPVLIAPNTSIGANLLALLAGFAGQILKNADIEICETHHRFKKDSPSGAAMFIAKHIASERGVDFNESACFNRHEAGVRKEGQIGVFGLRGGNQVGTHSVHLFEQDEALELTHRVLNRRVFASGALLAADFLVDQAPGIYNMFDVLHIKTLLGEKV